MPSRSLAPACLILVNPAAREGRMLSRLKSALAWQPAVAERAKIRLVRTVAEARVAVADLQDGEVPVAAGGDGTVNLVVTALRAEGRGDRPFGVLPLGTGNAFAHAFGMGSTQRALEALAANVARPADLMVLDQSPFVVSIGSVSTGFEALALRHADHRQGWSRAAAFLAGVIGGIGRYTTGCSISLDGEPFVSADDRVYNAGLYLLPCYGFGRRVMPDADLADGMAEAVAWESGPTYWRTLLGSLRTSDPRTASGLRTRRWRRARIQAALLQIDGETAPGGTLDLMVEAGGLRVIAPDRACHGAAYPPLGDRL